MDEIDKISRHSKKDDGWGYDHAIEKIHELGYAGAMRYMDGLGNHNTSRLNGEGIYDEMDENEIAKAMKLHEGIFCTVIAHDEINKIRMNAKKPSFWIQNTDNRGQDGTHWQAVWIDTHDRCFYDSFGRDPDAETLENIKHS